MAQPVTLIQIKQTLEEVLDRSIDVWDSQTVAKDVEGWDSLNNLRLLLQLEQLFNVDFPVQEIEKIQNVGQLLDLLNRLRAA